MDRGLTQGRPIDASDSIEAWDAAAVPLGIPGVELRAQVLLADSLMEDLLREDRALAAWHGLPVGTWL